MRPLLLALAFAACTGDVGPVGPEGPRGNDGANGTPGPGVVMQEFRRVGAGLRIELLLPMSVGSQMPGLFCYMTWGSLLDGDIATWPRVQAPMECGITKLGNGQFQAWMTNPNAEGGATQSVWTAAWVVLHPAQ